MATRTASAKTASRATPSALPARAARKTTPARAASRRPAPPAAQSAPISAPRALAAAAQPVKPAQPAADKPVKAAKPKGEKKPKLVRDSFTMPKPEYEVLAALKLRAAKLGQTPKKSELLRAGVKALAAMGDAGFLAALGAVPAIKTGRPKA
jgi:hypothetical protein